MKHLIIPAAFVLVFSSLLPAQTPPTKSLLGTVTIIALGTGELEVKSDNASSVTVKLSPNTLVQRIAPGQTNLSNAVTINISELSGGDRVLVTLAANGSDVLRIVVIPADDIAKRDEAERQDWNNRGISGIVAAKNGNQITVRTRTLQGQVLQQTVTISNTTKFRRYAPDSVKFTDAALSRLDEVSIGDQLRARGEKSPDGSRVQAEEVVFGTFLTNAGIVATVDAAAKQITLNGLDSGKPLIVKLSPDSQIKRLAAPPAGALSIAQMVEAMPAGKLEEIKPGTSIIVSSTKGAQSDQVTAILILANADLLIRMATTPTGRGGTLTFGAAGGAGGIDALGIGP